MEHLPDLCILLILAIATYEFLWVVECGEDLFQNSRHVEERRYVLPQKPESEQFLAFKVLPKGLFRKRGIPAHFPNRFPDLQIMHNEVSFK
jgi:hypothetical protein